MFTQGKKGTIVSKMLFCLGTTMPGLSWVENAQYKCIKTP